MPAMYEQHSHAYLLLQVSDVVASDSQQAHLQEEPGALPDELSPAQALKDKLTRLQGLYTQAFGQMSIAVLSI